jgi:hypothetical protein
MTKPLHQIKREPVAFLNGLRSDSPGASKEFAARLIAEARDYGLNMRDFLTLKIDVRGSDKPEQFSDDKGLFSGYEAALASLGLPVRNDFANGITVDLAADTFQTFPGTRALFPEVIDDMVRWNYRQNLLESPDPMLASSRTITGTELLSTVVNDDATDYRIARPIAEGAKIPVHSIRTSQQSVGIFKHGMGYRTTYEFSRRARLDILTPYAQRSVREIAISKTYLATNILVNGDGAYDAAPVVAQSSFNTKTGETAVNGKINWANFMAWLVDRAQKGVPVDTVVGNWDAYIQWLLMFAKPTANSGPSEVDEMARAGFRLAGIPVLTGTINFVPSSSAPANRLIGFSKADTLEELVEAGSLIDESERSVENQTVSYFKTENSGYHLVFGDTREIYNFNA